MAQGMTQRRLQDAFAAECAAYMKYIFYAQAARQEGLEQIADVLEETADNEKAHARLWFLALGEFAPGKQPGDTLKNLRAAAEGERLEWTEQYRQCAADARRERESLLEKQFEGVAAIEAGHEARFRALIERLEQGAFFSRPDQPGTLWRCRFCGHLHTGAQAPESCPVCGHPQGFYRRELKET